jgi:hypothetical protein
MRWSMPELSKALVKFDVDIEVYSVKWFFSMWSIDLPFDYAMTALDLYLVDQQRSLIRIALAIFACLMP